ncbi:hypothetical protein D3C87_1020730 [compost metagenome]
MHTEDDHQREEQAERRRRLDPRGVIAPAAVGRVFGHVSCSTAIFTAERQTLQHSQNDQDDRSGDADLRCAGQHADEEGRNAHDQDRDEKGIFTADNVAQAAEHQCTEGAHEEAGGKGQKRKDVACRFRILAEEVRTDIDRERAV